MSDTSEIQEEEITLPVFEYDQQDRYAQYMIKNRREIGFHLKAMINHRTFLTLYINDGDVFYLTNLIEVDEEENRLVFDAPLNPDLLEKTLKARQIAVSAILDRVKIQLRLQTINFDKKAPAVPAAWPRRRRGDVTGPALAPDRRFAPARSGMSAFLGGGGREALRTATKSMVSKGMGGPRRAAATMRATAQGAGQLAVEDFERLMDNTTPYYKARFEDLSEQAQVVMHALAVRRLGNGSGLRFGHTAAEIGSHAGLATGTVSAQMDVLEREGLVEKSAAHGRTQYRIAEQLFRLWLQMRSNRRIRQNGL